MRRSLITLEIRKPRKQESVTMSDVRTIVKKEDYATLYSDGTILVREVRASYPHLFAPFQGPPDKETGRIPPPRWGIVGLMPKEQKYLKSKDLIRNRIMEIIRSNKEEDLPADRKFLRNGDDAGKAEYKGTYSVSAGEVLARRPALRGNTRDPITKKPVILVPGKDDDVIYAGCWVTILIRPWWQPNKGYGKRVNAGLAAVQFVRDDEAFGSGRISDDEIDSTFETIDDDDSGYDDEL